MCMASLALVSCSDDDDEKDDSQVDKSVLIGKWVLTNYTDEYTEDGKTETDTESCEVAVNAGLLLSLAGALILLGIVRYNRRMSVRK